MAPSDPAPSGSSPEFETFTEDIDSETGERITFYIPVATFEVDGIVYDPRQRGNVLRAMISPEDDRGGGWRWQPGISVNVEAWLHDPEADIIYEETSDSNPTEPPGYL